MKRPRRGRDRRYCSNTRADSRLFGTIPRSRLLSERVLNSRREALVESLPRLQPTFEGR
jgi:hypothetical protein